MRCTVIHETCFQNHIGMREAWYLARVGETPEDASSYIQTICSIQNIVRCRATDYIIENFSKLSQVLVLSPISFISPISLSLLGPNRQQSIFQ